MEAKTPYQEACKLIIWEMKLRTKGYLMIFIFFIFDYEIGLQVVLLC